VAIRVFWAGQIACNEASENLAKRMVARQKHLENADLSAPASRSAFLAKN
jgi:predicted chitinase